MLKLKKGFTLVELLVVIAIIGILAALLILRLGSSSKDARNARRRSDMNQIKTAIEQWKAKGCTPASSKGASGDPLAASKSVIQGAASGTDIIFVDCTIGSTTYKPSDFLKGDDFPKDPQDAYYGIYTDSTGAYVITRGDGTSGASTAGDAPSSTEVPDVKN